MAKQFQYKIQVNGVGKTHLDQEVPFLIQETFDASVDLNYYSYETGKILNSDHDGNFTYDTIQEMMAQKVKDYCTRYSIEPDTVTILAYQLVCDEVDVVVYFNPSNPTKLTSDGSSYIYAYYINDTAPPSSPINITTVSDETAITIIWEMEEHHHGVHVYNENKQFIATVHHEVNVWRASGLEENELYTYYIASFNNIGESAHVKVEARTVSDVPTFTPPVAITDPESSYVPIEGEDQSLQAFQSGVGDGTDLLVTTSKTETSKETFSYNMQIKGFEENKIHIFPEREFQYRIIAEDEAGNVVKTSAYRIGVLDGREPMVTDGSGKHDLVLPLEISKPDTTSPVRYRIEITDPDGFVNYRFEKGAYPYTEHLDDTVTFYTIENSKIEKLIRTPYYGPRIQGKGLYTIEQGTVLEIDEELPSATYDPILSTKNIVDWKIILNSTNPNVNLFILEAPPEFMGRKRFIYFKIGAKITNPTQTPWNPLIHNGYYYLNQAEHYLYSESKIKGKATSDRDFIPYKFVYGIDLEATRTEYGQLQEWKDRYRGDFKGTLSQVTLTDEDDTEVYFKLEGSASQGNYISESKILKNTANTYSPIEWNAKTPGTSEVKLYTQSRDEDGVWSNWVEEVNGQTIQSPPSDAFKYKAELISGIEEVATTTDYLDTDKTDFEQALVEEPSPVLNENVEFLEGYMLIKDLDKKTGIFTSRTFDFTSQLYSFGKVTYVSLIPPGDGGEVTVYTATSDVDDNWETAIWQPLRNVSKQDDTYIGEIQSEVKQYIKYQVRFTRSSELEGKEWSTVEFEEGRLYNLIRQVTSWDTSQPTPTPLTYGDVIIDDMTQEGVYISPAIHFDNNVAWLLFDAFYELPESGGGVVIKTASSDNQGDLDTIGIHDTRWTVLDSNGKIQSPVRDYLAIKVEMTAGSTTSGTATPVTEDQSPVLKSLYVAVNTENYYSPLFHSCYLIGNTYELKPVSPKLYWVKVGATYQDILTKEYYSTSIADEIPSDGDLHKISDVTVKEIVDDMLVKQGVNESNLTRDLYRLTINQGYGVSLSSRDDAQEPTQYQDHELEKGYVYAQTTNVAQEHIYNELKVKVDENNEALVTPIPQQGSPVVVLDHSGKELVQTSFYTENFQPTFTCKEEVISNQLNELYLGNYHIDSSTIELEYLDEATGKWESFIDFQAYQNYVKLYPSLKPGTLFRASYKITNSYYIDYNFDTENDYAKIVFYSPELDDSREVKIVYETNKDSAYYYSSEIDLNPLKNIQHTGFLYLTDKIEKATHMDIQFTPDVLFANGYDTTWVRVIVSDKFDNPVVGEKVELHAEIGTIEMIQSETDQNGMVIAKYIASDVAGVDTLTAINQQSKLETSSTVKLIPEKTQARMSIETSEPTVVPAGYWDHTLATPVWISKPGYEIIVRAQLFGYNQEPVTGSDIQFTCSSEGVFESDLVQTNTFGEAVATLYVTDIPENGIVVIHADSSDYEINASTIVRVENFRDYDASFFARANHLIEIPDREAARENLGIYAKNKTIGIEVDDIWIDKEEGDK